MIKSIKEFKCKYKDEFDITTLNIIAIVFAVLGRDAAFCVWAPDGVLTFCSNTISIIVGSLLLPMVIIVCGLVFKSSSQKVIAVVFSKLILEIVFVSVGVNINCFSPVFYSDLSVLFFILIDVALLISLVNEKAEKTVSGIIMILIFILSVFTIAININNVELKSYVYRMAYVYLIYMSVFLVVLDMKVRKPVDNIQEQINYLKKKELDKFKLLFVMILVAICGVTTVCFVINNKRSEVLSIGVELACYISWSALYLLAALFINVKRSVLKNFVLSACVATVATLTVVVINTYGQILRYYYWFVKVSGMKFYNMFMRDIKHGFCLGWLRYLISFVLVFIVSLIVSTIVEKKTAKGKWRVFSSGKSLLSGDEDNVDYGESDSIADNFVFEKAMSVEDYWNYIFNGDSFTMDGKDYDILLTFDNEDQTEKFIVYTDNSVDDDGNVNVFASKYNPQIAIDKLIPIEDNEEWEGINYLLNCAMETANQNDKNKKDSDNSDVNIDPFTTLSYLAKAIATNKNNNGTFILTTKGVNEGNDVFGVTVCGSSDDLKNLLKYTMLSVTKALKLDFIGAYGELNGVMKEVIKEIYEGGLKKIGEDSLGEENS